MSIGPPAMNRLPPFQSPVVGLPMYHWQDRDLTWAKLRMWMPDFALACEIGQQEIVLDVDMILIAWFL
jgi:hypothetical protein